MPSTRSFRFTVLIAAVVAVAALWSLYRVDAQPAGAGNAPSQQQPAPHQQPASPAMPGGGTGMMQQQYRAGCPMLVPGTKVSMSNIPGGVALTFTTDTGNVGDLRARVQHLAQMYQMHQAHQSMMWRHMSAGMGQGGGMMGPGSQGMGQGGSMDMAMPAATTTVTNVPNGARVELRPTDPSQLGALRESIRYHRQRFQSGACWASQQQPTSGPRREHPRGAPPQSGQPRSQ